MFLFSTALPALQGKLGFVQLLATKANLKQGKPQSLQPWFYERINNRIRRQKHKNTHFCTSVVKSPRYDFNLITSDDKSWSAEGVRNMDSKLSTLKGL